MVACRVPEFIPGTERLSFEAADVSVSGLQQIHPIVRDWMCSVSGGQGVSEIRIAQEPAG